MLVGILAADVSVISSLNAADFRGLNWGADIKAVEKNEKTKPVEQYNAEIVYSIKLGEEPVNVFYRFDDKGKLISGGYQFSRQYRESEKYTLAYDALQDVLTKKYGKPANVVLNCDDDFYSSYPHRWGTGIVVGKLTRQSDWVKEKVVVTHRIASLPGGTVGHVVEYSQRKSSGGEYDNAAILGAL